MILQTLIIGGVTYFLVYWSAACFSNQKQKQAFFLQFFLLKETCNLVQVTSNDQGTVFS